MAARPVICSPSKHVDPEAAARRGRSDGDARRGRVSRGVPAGPRAAISRPLDAARGAGPFGAGFVAQRELADLLFRKCVRRVGAGLVACDGKDYRLREAVRVLGCSDGHSDPYGLTGLVETLDDLVRAGASLTGGAMRLGSATYRVERGVVAVARELGGGPPMPAD